MVQPACLESKGIPTPLFHRSPSCLVWPYFAAQIEAPLRVPPDNALSQRQSHQGLSFKVLIQASLQLLLRLLPMNYSDGSCRPVLRRLEARPRLHQNLKKRRQRGYSRQRTPTYTMEIHTWNAITFVSNVKTISKLLEQKAINAYLLQLFF